MKLHTLASFDVHKEGLSWPWIAFAASGSEIAFASSPSTFATRKLTGSAAVQAGPSFTLPAGATLADVRAFALCPLGEFAVLTATHLHVMHEDAIRTVALATLAPDAGLEPRAALFSRSGAELWISAETKEHVVLFLVDVAKLTLLGIDHSKPLPPPASHELYLHPQDDAVLLVAACGEEGTFARVVGFAGGVLARVTTALDDGSIAAGFVGFSADGTRLHLAESDELRTHAWPGLLELSSVELADDFIGAFSGAVMHDRVLVDGHEDQDGDGGSDAVMSFDVSATLGSWLLPPFPEGMWAGRLGSTSLVTVQPKGNPARGSVIRVDEL